MDLSKLPKLSNSPAPPPETSSTAGDVTSATPRAAEHYQPAADARSSFADVWISIGIGVILLVLSPRFLQWMLSKAGVGTFTWTFSDPQGNPLPYSKTVFFLGDLAVFAFAIVLILDGLVSALRRPRLLLMMAIGLTAITVLMNAYYVVTMFSGYGPQLFSLLAVVFGIYILSMQLARLKAE